MLRELTIRELSDVEMDMVSGGEGDEIVVTGTRTPRRSPVYQPYVVYDTGAFSANAAGLAAAGLQSTFANLSSPGNTVGSFTTQTTSRLIDIGGDGMSDLVVTTTIEIEVQVPLDNEGSLGGCLQTPFGCINLGEWP